MLGAIIGDIAWSRFEWDNVKTKDFDLMTSLGLYIEIYHESVIDDCAASERRK